MPLSREAAIEGVSGELGNELVKHGTGILGGGDHRVGIEFIVEGFLASFDLSRGQRAIPANLLLKVEEEGVGSGIADDPAVLGAERLLTDDSIGSGLGYLLDAGVDTESGRTGMPIGDDGGIEIGERPAGGVGNAVHLALKGVDLGAASILQLNESVPLGFGFGLGFGGGDAVGSVIHGGGDVGDFFFGKKVLASGHFVENPLGIVEAVKVVDEVVFLFAGKPLEVLVAEDFDHIVPVEAVELLGGLGEGFVDFLANDGKKVGLKKPANLPHLLGKLVIELGAELANLEIASALDGSFHHLAKGIGLVDVALGKTEMVKTLASDLDDDASGLVLDMVAHGKVLVAAKLTGEIADILSLDKRKLVVLGRHDAGEIDLDLVLETLVRILLGHVHHLHLNV